MSNKLTISIILGLLCLAVWSFPVSGIDINSCRTLDGNGSYTLTQDVVNHSTCFAITSDNVSLDCNGFTINYSESQVGQGVNATGRVNITVRGCRILQTNTSLLATDGILFSSTNSSFVYNNTVISRSRSSDSIDISAGHNINVSYNTVNSTDGIGIRIGGGSFNTTILSNIVFTNNTISIFALGGSNYTILDNTVFTNTSVGIVMDGSILNTVINNTAVSRSGQSISLEDGADVNFLLNNTFITDVGIALRMDGVFNNSLVNTTLLSNATWIQKTGTGTLNNITNTLFSSIFGSIQSLLNITIPLFTNVTTQNLNVSFNNTFLNSSNISFLNVTSKITMLGLSLINPQLQVDFDDDETFENCNATICQEISFAGTTLIFNVSTFTTFQAVETETECGFINASANMTKNLTSIGTCFTVTANDVVLDCSGFTVKFGTTGVASVYGINATSVDNVTVKNCIFDHNNTGTMVNGIHFQNSNFSTIFNNTVFSQGTSSRGISSFIGGDNNVTQNTINVSGTTAIGILQAANDVATNNNIIVFSGSDGIRTSTNSTADFNTIFVSGQGFGIKASSTGAEILDNNIISLEGTGISITGDSNLISNNSVLNSNKSIELQTSSNSRVFQNNLSNNTFGIIIEQNSEKNLVFQNKVYNSTIGIMVVFDHLSFDVSTLNNGLWEVQDTLHYTPQLETQTTDLSSGSLDNNGVYRVRLQHFGEQSTAAHMDSVLLRVNGILQAPTSVTNLDDSEDITFKAGTSDLDLVDVYHDLIEATWAGILPTDVVSLELTAREEFEGMARTPFSEPESFAVEPAYHSYVLAEQTTPVIDGEITADDHYGPVKISREWHPSTGHPVADNEWYITNDEDMLYVGFDFTSDNTFDFEEDWSAVYVDVDGTPKQFKLDVTDQTYGTVGFVYGGSVSYQHKVYEFAIPLSEMHLSAGDTANLAFQAYGTAAIAPSHNNNITENTLINNSLGFRIFNSNNISIVNNTFATNFLDIEMGTTTGVRIINTSLEDYNFSSVQFSIENELTRIEFLSTFNENGTNLSKDIVLTNNTVFVNSSAHTGFNISANLTFFGTTFANPLALADTTDSGVLSLCSSTICGSIFGAATTFFFNVTQFTTFQLIDDFDGDGIPDSTDSVIGNASNVTTSGVTNLNITINGSTNNGSITGVQEVLFFDGTRLLMNFTFNFSASVLDLRNISILIATNSIVVNVSNQTQNKTLYLPDLSYASICVHDGEIGAVAEISTACTAPNETQFVSCSGVAGGTTLGGITCYDQGTQFKFDNLSFSGVTGTIASTTSSSSGGGGGGGGGGRSSALFINVDAGSKEFDLRPGQRQWIIRNGVQQQLEVSSIGNVGTTAEVTVTSLGITKTLANGEFFTFDADLDGIEDTKVSLTRIHTIRATLMAQPFTGSAPAQQASAPLAESSTGTQETSEVQSVETQPPITGDVARPSPTKNTMPFPANQRSPSRSSWPAYLLVGALLLGGIGFIKRKKLIGLYNKKFNQGPRY